MNQNNKNKYEIDAKQIFDAMFKYWWLIAISVAACVSLALGFTALTDTTTYTSSATLLINGGGTGMTSYQQILAGQYQSKDYPYILMSKDTLGAAADVINATGELPDKTYTAGTLAGMVTSKSEEDSRIFIISVTSSDPDEARIVAERVSDEFLERAEHLTKAEVGVVEEPRDPVRSSNSDYKKNIIVGAAVGVIVGVAISILLGLKNDTLDSEDWLIERYKDCAPLLSSIPDSSASGGRGYYKYRYRYKSQYNYSAKNKSGE